MPPRVVARAATAILLSSLLAAVVVARLPAAGDAAPRVSRLPIDVNRASVHELCLLPGVGPSLARAIAEDRSARGAFRGPADLDRVKGIGPGILARIAPHVSFVGASGDAAAYAAR